MSENRPLPLAPAHQTAGARMSNFFGWQVPAHFGDPEQEYHNARGAVALFDASFLTIVSAKGKDLLDYLNRRLSQRVIEMAIGEGLRANQLGGDGRMEADMQVYRVKEHEMLLVAPPGVRGEYLAALCDKYVFSEDAVFTDISGSMVILALVGPDRFDAARAAGLANPSEGQRINGAMLAGIPVYTFETEFLPDSLLIAAPAEHAFALHAALSPHTRGPLGLLPFDTVRVEAAVPWWGIDLNEKSIPLEADLLSAIHTNKGCYPGQETIAKILNLGHPARKMVGVEINSEDPPPPGSALLLDGREVGILTSPTWSPRLKKAIGLAMVRWPQREPGTALTVADGASATVCGLPFPPS